MEKSQDDKRKRNKSALIALGIMIAYAILIGPSIGGSGSSASPAPTQPINTASVPQQTICDTNLGNIKVSSVDYKQLEKDPGSFEGQYATYKGQILQIQQSGNEGVIRLSVVRDGDFWDPSSVIFVTYHQATSAVEGDVVTITGKLMGTETYTSQANYQITIPSIDVCSISTRASASPSPMSKSTTPVHKSTVASSVPTPPASNVISLKTAELNIDQSQSVENTIEGVVVNLIPSSFAPQFNNGNEIMIEDTKDHSYETNIFNISDAAYGSISLGDIVHVKGIMRGGGASLPIDGDPVVVGHDNSIPSPATVLSEANALVQEHQSDIDQALQNVQSSTSFDQCAQINDTLVTDLCSEVGTCSSGGVLPYVYKGSMTVINNAVSGLVNACSQKFLHL